MSSSAGPTRRLILLGATGSIGCSTLEVVEHLNRTGAGDIQVVGLAASRSIDRLVEHARRFNVQHLAIADPQLAQPLQQAVPDATIYAGPDGPTELVRSVQATDLAAAMVGSAGLPATLAAVELGLRVSLANKETLVAAGALVRPAVEQHGATLLPVDSEHSAIFQCLQARAADGPPAVERIVLTASGGPFREADADTIAHATPEQALNHPTWNMGPKITIDSATMMNKALEIIEARWLFNLTPEQIDVIIHPQSTVHSFVEFADHSILAQLGPPDMRHPIQYALTYPDRAPGCSKPLDWAGLSQLTFEQPDFERFPALRLAYDVLEAGGTAGAIFNAANEAAVQAFLDGQIRFGRIIELVESALKVVVHQPADSLDIILAADRQARQFVAEHLPTPRMPDVMQNDASING